MLVRTCTFYRCMCIDYLFYVHTFINICSLYSEFLTDLIEFFWGGSYQTVLISLSEGQGWQVCLVFLSIFEKTLLWQYFPLA